MNCPLCSAELQISQRQGIEIDHCPACRGVWLDRGELDKLINQAIKPSDDARAGQRMYYDDDSDGNHSPQHHRGRHDRSHPPKKRGFFLSELFDFG